MRSVLFLLLMGVLLTPIFGLGCVGPDSGDKYYVGQCADYDKDPSIPGKYCSASGWVDWAHKCSCPSGYQEDYSESEDGKCVKVEESDSESESNTGSGTISSESQEGDSGSQPTQTEDDSVSEPETSEQSEVNETVVNETDSEKPKNVNAIVVDKGFVYSPIEHTGHKSGVCLGAILLMIIPAVYYGYYSGRSW